MPKTMTPDELFEYLESQWQWVWRISDNDKCAISKTMPTWKSNNGYSGCEYALEIPFIINFGTGDLTNCIAQRKPRIEVGQFGKFWPTIEGNYVYDYLAEINDEGKYIRKNGYNGSGWDNFIPMTEPKPLEE